MHFLCIISLPIFKLHKNSWDDADSWARHQLLLLPWPPQHRRDTVVAVAVDFAVVAAAVGGGGAADSDFVDVAADYAAAVVDVEMEAKAAVAVVGADAAACIVERAAED